MSKRCAVVVGILTVAGVVNAQEKASSERTRCEFGITHINDANFMGGNDEGFTFGNTIFFKLKSQNSKDQTSHELSVSLENNFFTHMKSTTVYFQDFGNFRVFERAPDGKVFLDFIEEYRLAVSERQWQDSSETQFWEFGCDITFESSAESATGSKLQAAAHRAAGMEAGPDEVGTYNYSQNSIDLERWGLELYCHRGARIEGGDNFSCEVFGGFRAKSVALDDSSIALGAELRVHTLSTQAFDHDKPALMAFARCSSNQYIDFENRDTVVGAGVESNLALTNDKNFSCRLEWTKPLEVNDTLHNAMVDKDNLLQLSVGIVW